MSGKRSNDGEDATLAAKKSKYANISSSEDDSDSSDDEYTNYLEKKKKQQKVEVKTKAMQAIHSKEVEPLTQLDEHEMGVVPTSFAMSMRMESNKTVEQVECEIQVLRQTKNKLNISDIPIEELAEGNFDLIKTIREQTAQDKKKWARLSEKESELSSAIASRDRSDLVDMVYTNPAVNTVRKIQRQLEEFDRIEEEDKLFEQQQQEKLTKRTRESRSNTPELMEKNCCFTIHNMFLTTEEPIDIMENDSRSLKWIREMVAKKCNAPESSLILKFVPSIGIINEVSWEHTPKELGYKELPETNEFWVDRDNEANLIRLKFKSGNGKSADLKIDKTVPLSQHISLLARSLSLSAVTRLIFDCDVVDLQKTADQLELEQDDCIEVYE